MKNVLPLLLCLFAGFLSGCEKDKMYLEKGYRIEKLFVIGAQATEDRTAEIPACRMDDIFVFEEVKVMVRMADDLCPGDPGIYQAGHWRMLTIDSLAGNFISLSIGAFYTVHDSMYVGHTTPQWVERRGQIYEVLVFDEENIILRNTSLSEPLTDRQWELRFKKIRE